MFTRSMRALSTEEIEKVATGPFLDPVIQEFSIGKPIAP